MNVVHMLFCMMWTVCVACDKVVPSYSGLKVPKKVHSGSLFSRSHRAFMISHFLYCEALNKFSARSELVSANVCEE